MSCVRMMVAALIGTTMLSTPCDAQIVRWGGYGGVGYGGVRYGGVRVRAPFVAVDVSPFGSTRVRAPFTSVYAPGPGFPYRLGVVGPPVIPVVPPFVMVPAVRTVPVPVFSVPAYPEMVFDDLSIGPEGYQVMRPSLDGHVTEDLHRAAIHLQQSLLLRHDGDVWLTYLGPERIIASIERGDAPNSLRDLIPNYDGVVANGSLRAIQLAVGFNKTRELLRVYVDLPVSMQRTTPESMLEAEVGETSPTPNPPTPNPPAVIPHDSETLSDEGVFDEKGGEPVDI